MSFINELAMPEMAPKVGVKYSLITSKSEADGMSLDDKRTPLLSEGKLGTAPKTALTADEHAKNNLPDILARWQKRDGSERKRPRSAQSFCVPKADLVAQGYDLNLNRYKEVVHVEVAHRPPARAARRPR
jgi:type I restriction enzyme M protein